MATTVTTTTVRDATFDVLRERGLTTLFANPGSTEIQLLSGLPEDLRFVLALHEASVIGLASGLALATNEPALAILHTTAGLGNAVAALATARVNRAPLVVIVGQQDRRHLATQPFLAGRLEGLAGEYPVSVEQPVRAQDVPGAISRAYHAARTHRGPALVIVPMDDWIAPADEGLRPAAPKTLRYAAAADAEAVGELAALLEEAENPALVVGAGADDEQTWAALVTLAERLVAPVWQEAFTARAGFPQDHPLFAGFLSHARTALREQLAGHDVILSVGAPVFRQYAFVPGPLLPDGATIGLITDDADEAHRSPADIALLAPIASACRALAERVAVRHAQPASGQDVPPAPAPPAPGEPMLAGHVLAALAERLPADAVVLEESPSNRPELQTRLHARQNMGFVSAAMGGLGFGLPAAAGLRMGLPDRPVVAILGDGASLYAIQGLWTAAREGIGALWVIMANGRYAVMDRLAAMEGAHGPWPAFEEVDVAAIARGFGCPAKRISDHGELLATLDEVIPTLAQRREPLLLSVDIAP
jgi:thiamine pyrophosphate-dependent acetolactate synthase large subunit-like protein